MLHRTRITALAGALAIGSFTPALSAQETPAPSPTPAPAAEAPPAHAKAPPPEEEESAATGVENRFLSLNTPMTIDKGVFEARIQHRFYQSWIESGGGGAFGLDSSANVALWMDYAFIKNAAIQIGRTSNLADYEAALKVTFLRPTPRLPIGLGIRGGIDWNTAFYATKQSSGFGQILLSATIGDRVTVAFAPTFVQRTQTTEEVWNYPVALQIKITKSIAAMAELIPRYRTPNTKYQWSFGVEKSVFHHKFALWLGNSGATTIDQMMDGAYNGGVTDYNFHIGFNIARQFDISVD